MQKIVMKIFLLAVGFLLVFAIYHFYPYLLFKVIALQKSFHQQISSSMLALQKNQHSGWILISISFFYGIFHAVGPGHGKFILTSYLSFEKTKLPQAIRLTLLSSLAQGVMAILLVSIIVVIFTLSRHYFNLALQWIERGSFTLMILFGCYWCYNAIKSFKIKMKKTPKFNVQKVTKILPLATPLLPSKMMLHNHQHSANCGCGHQHLPNSAQLSKATDWKAQLMIILSIASRPCSGAILVLFFSYTLDLYYWGVFSALAMAIGTGFTLTLFAVVVLFARHKAISLSKWYLSIQMGNKISVILKLIVGMILIIFGVLLLQSSFVNILVKGNGLFT
ncbi:High-affinity nickel-transport protein [Phocoenobacter uteri]|uniref:Nickel/cobalt efflux system n=1 Tax=Phocoenobacter uteri TaxID=146806 RepID=A0A379CAC8_9PAST|nr:nickel/cobalt transporter [Phocoenobacter uteri]MDG6881199.1 cobalt transporter [Phocoenobacter uteri]SUB59221.1 High-affinity nickel-transport protein [Phocoenobacter uteri]